MKELIKHILNEEVSKQQIDKGIDIVVNGLKKEFPFVVGWKLHDNYDEYITSIFIRWVKRGMISNSHSPVYPALQR